MIRLKASLLALGVALAAAAPARAQAPAEADAAAHAAAEQRRALDEAREALKQTEERRERIAAEVEALKGERGKLQATLVATVASIREKEPGVAQRETRIGQLDESERQLKASLIARRAVLAEVIAALQRMGRQPPPALLVRPNDALEALRSAILLGAVVPDMRAEAEALGSDLREMVRLKDLQVKERDALAHEIADLGAERERLAALVEERKRQLGQRETDLSAEGERVVAASRDVGDLEALIRRMEAEQAKRAAEEAAKPGPEGAGAGGGAEVSALREAGRLAPAVAFDKAKGLLPLPVSGKRLMAYGATDGSSGGAKGVSFAAQPGAPVTAPCDGWVVYVGPFRSYGQLLILNAGGGYHVVLAGMERITVGLNQFVLAGEPVATMRGDANSASMAARSAATNPVLYVEFRNERGSIDPTPWWAGTSGEKAGG
jgi:septal ring factor EnvC (AmiA/AmiB activator)